MNQVHVTQNVKTSQNQPVRDVCPICNNEGWVCEDHAKTRWGWGDNCCGGAGMPCECNDYDPPWHYPSE